MFVGVCLCGTVEVIISGGRRDFLVPVVVLRGAVPGRVSQLVSSNSPPLPLSPEPISCVIPSQCSLSQPPVSL